MKVVMVANSAADGGAERVAVMLANYFCKQGYDVTYAAVLLDDIGYPLDSRIRYVFCGNEKGNKITRNFRRYSNLYKLVKKVDADVVISFMTLENILLPLKKGLYKIYSMRSDPTRTFNTGYEKILRDHIYGKADKLVFQTQNIKEYFNKKIQDKGVIIGNPLIEGLPDWNPENDSKTIVAAGRLTEAKNFSMLIDAFSLFLEKRPGYLLKIYGDGELRDKLQAQIDSKGIPENVILAGNVKNIHEIMAESEVYVSSSDFEGISNSMLEALGIGVPVICTDVPSGGAREYIQDGINGFLTNVGDAQMMSQKLLELCGNKELEKAFSKEAVKIRDELKIERICGMWEDLIKNKS